MIQINFNLTLYEEGSLFARVQRTAKQGREQEAFIGKAETE